MRFSGLIHTRLEGAGRALDRREERLPTAWIRGADTPAPTTATLDCDPSAPIAWSGATKSAIVMLSGRCAGAEGALDDALASGARVYVIAPEGWGEGVRGGPFAKSSRAHALVRRVARPPATAVWTSERAWIWFGDNAAEPGWRMGLDATQAEALRLACLRLFWHHGLDEGHNRDGVVAFRACGRRPFDVPEAREDAALRISEGVLPLDEGAPEALVYTDSVATLPTRAARVWCPPSGAGHPSLARLTDSGAEVVWAPLALPRCIVSPKGAFVSPTSAHWSMSLRLSSEQREELSAILRAPTPWRFQRDVALREIEVGADLRVLLPGADDAVPLTVDETLVAPQVRSPSLRACEAAEPPFWPAPRPLTLTARWRWEVLPPTLPKGSKDDPLIEAWRQLDRAFEARVKASQQSLQGVREQQGTLARTFEALKGALLGFDRTLGGIELRLRELAKEVPSQVGPEQARALGLRLGDVEQEVATLVRDVDAAEQRAREDKERAEQRATYEGAREENTRHRGRRQTELDAQRRRLAALDEQIEALSKTPDGESPAQAKDREVALMGCRDEHRKAKRHVELLEGQVRELEQSLAREFVFRPSASKTSPRGGAGFVPAAMKTELRPPSEALPSVGRLVTAKQRYLAIKVWEDLDAGEREAERLSASLVADQEDA